MLSACAGLYVAGRAPHWQQLNGGAASVVNLPAYPWQRERHWLPAPAISLHRTALGAPIGDPLLGRRLAVAGAAVFETTWPGTAPAWLSEHRIGGRLLLPGMVMLETLRRAACVALAADDVELRDFVIHQALVLDDAGMPTTWQVVVPDTGPADLKLALHVADAAHPGGWRKVASAEAVADASAGAAAPASGETVGAGVSSAEIYRAFDTLGTAFGPAFRTLERVVVRDSEATAWLQLTPATDGSLALLMDGALQACAVACGGGLPREPLVPVAVERLRWRGAVPARVRADVSVRRDGLSVTAHVTLRDPDGAWCGELGGVRLLPRAATSGIADDWLHQIQWVTASEATTQSAPTGWIVLCDRAGAGTALAQSLREQGHRCVLVGTQGCGAAPALCDLTIDHTDTSQWQRLLRQAPGPSGPSLTEVVHLWGIDPDVDTMSLDSATLALLQALAAHTADGGLRLTMVTAGAQPTAGALTRPAAAHLWGLGGVAMVEHPELSLRLIDLDPDAAAWDAVGLAERLQCRGNSARRWVQRGGQWFEPRLVHSTPLPETAPALHLVPAADATLDGLAWQALTPPAPLAGELRIRVLACGLNFRDVLIALGMVPGQQVFLGAECAGVVEAVGSGITGLGPGTVVIGFAPGALATSVVVDHRFVAPWPADLGSVELAASLPVAFLTAMLGLERIAGLRAGQRVLIHAATGGVGLAAVQIAQRAGAQVFATAGSDAKRDLLQRLGVQHVFDSRSLDFARGVIEATGGAGVDVVLNSLAGEFIEASVGVLAAHGCFLELGKRDVWPAERFARVRPRGRYAVYDLGTTAQQQPEVVRTMLDELLAALRTGTLRALPLRVFAFADAARAFRFMAQARHTGKLVLRAPLDSRSARELSISAQATYLITGGLGALGLHTARWLVRNGARHLVLIARRAADDSARRAIAEMAALGAQIDVHAADVSDAPAMRALLAHTLQHKPPLRGVVHAAGALDDGVLIRQTRERFEAVRRGKAVGAQVLDELTRELPLDFFVLYSAAGQWLGASGQGPYAAANAELDALAARRRASGLPALSVAWGQWHGGGMATATAAQGHDSWTARGMRWIEPDAGIRAPRTSAVRRRRCGCGAADRLATFHRHAARRRRSRRCSIVCAPRRPARASQRRRPMRPSRARSNGDGCPRANAAPRCRRTCWSRRCW